MNLLASAYHPGVSSSDEFRRRLRGNRWFHVCAWVLVVAGVVGTVLALLRGEHVNVIVQIVVLFVGLGFAGHRVSRSTD
jgi:hypothetical protein